MKSITIATGDNFSFKNTVYSHGWSNLKPFEVVENPLTLYYSVCLPQNRIYRLHITATNDGQLQIKADENINTADGKEIEKLIKCIFRLDEDYTEFYQLADKNNAFKWVKQLAAGRLLRCGSLWEDMVKMLCTTNCTWRLTQIMTENLVKKLGHQKNGCGNNKIIQTFPGPESVVQCSESFLRNEIKMGYRSPYLLEFASAITTGKLDLLQFEDQTVSTEDLYKNLRAIKGFGDYAVSNLLKLLGRYDYMGADSWSRKKFAEKHFKGKPCDDNKINSFYKKFGKWCGLFFWMDVSEDWYRKEIPW
jgi:N-glycosylase/DNA lyase